MSKKLIIIASVVACIAALSIGLGVGLTRNTDDVDDDEIRDTTPWENFRLPDTIVPELYSITLRPDVINDISYGSEIVTINVLKRTNTVIIHALEDLTGLTKFVVKQNGFELEKIDEFYYNAEKQQYYVVQLTTDLEIGSAELDIEWAGPLVSSLVGINKVTYQDEGQTKYIIATKFEPTYAREAFPCFDEPAMKAKYDLVMYHEDTHRALWNMPIDGTENCGCSDCPPGHCRTKFLQSPIMGTYQPTFIIHDMGYVEDTYVRDNGEELPVRIYAPFDKLSQTQHGLTVQMAVIGHYEKLYGIPYALPKLDCIAIPDFVTGAMEQWGLITYRETSLLFDSADGSTASKQSKASTIAHEMVHQWFGNLVTPEWWNNIWINEGPASFWSDDAIEAAFPEDDWQMSKQQVYDSIIYSLNKDITAAGRAIVSPVSNPDEITASFDWVIYDKAASIIYMMREALGHDNFNSAITNFLQFHEYSNTNDIAFIQEIQGVIDSANIQVNGEVLDAMDLFLPFFRQPLYPLVSVDLVGDTLKIKQGDRPFLHNPDSELAESEFGYQYSVILRWTQTEDEQIIGNSEIEVPATDGVIKLNRGQTGYYRVKYDGVLQQRIIDQLNNAHTEIDELDRTGLIDDAFNLAIAGEIPYSAALDMIKYVSKTDNMEESYFVWSVFSARTSYMRSQLAGTPTGVKFIAYFQEAIAAQFTRFGFTPGPTDSHIEKKHRSTMASLAVSFGVEAAKVEAKALYADWKADANKKPNADIAGTVYNLGVQEGDYDDWSFMFEKYQTEIVADEKKRYMRAMAGTTNVTTIDYMLNTLAKDKTIILEQDFFTFIAYISYSDVGNKMTWDWTRVHWEYLEDRFTTGDRNFGRLAPNMVDEYNTEYQLWSVEDFFSVTVAGAGEGPRAGAISQIKSNILWMANYVDDIDNWLDTERTLSSL